MVELVWTEVDSTNVDAVAYHEPTETLAVKFRGGVLYTYKDVDMEVYVDLVHAESVGKYLNTYIKGTNPYLKWSSEEEMAESLHP